MQENTRRIIKEDIEAIRAYADCFDVEMPDLDEKGEVIGLPAPYPREVAGVVRSGYRVYELAKLAEERGIPIQNPILGRNDIDEHVRESNTMYSYAERFGETVLHFVHSEATRHLDPLKARELIEQSRGKGGVTPKGEREFVQRGGGSRHPIRINATGDMPHISIINALIAGFDMTDVGPVIHCHFGGRGIQDYRTKLVNGFKALQICAENNMYVQLDSQKHVNNIGGTPGMGLAMCLLAEGMAHLAGLPWELSCIQMNIGGNNLFADQAVMRAFKKTMSSKALVVVPETFQNPPGNLIAEAAHFARMATSAMYGGAHFYRPKAAESVGIPTGESMGQAIWGTWDVFSHTVKLKIDDPAIDTRQNEIIEEAMAVLEAALDRKDLTPEKIDDEFWESFTIDELIDKIVYAGKTGILDTQRAGGWDLKRHVKVNKDTDGMVRYVKGFSPFGVDEKRLRFSQEDVHVVVDKPPTKPEKIVLATVGADAHVNGINLIKDTFMDDGYEIIFLRGMNLPETVAEVAAEADADAIGISNLLGMGQTLFPRVGQRLAELGLRDRIVIWAGGRVAEKEEEQKSIQQRIETEGVDFLGVDAFFGPDSTPEDCLETIKAMMAERKAKRS